MSSCMNFPADACGSSRSTRATRTVYRYRWPTVGVRAARTPSATRLGAATSSRSTRTTASPARRSRPRLLLDFSDAFDDNGTPTDFSDDKPRGTPLPCARRESSTAADPWRTSAFVEDCVDGEGGPEPARRGLAPAQPARRRSRASRSSARSTTWASMTSSGDNVDPPFDATQDIFVSHEAELTQSGRYILEHRRARRRHPARWARAARRAPTTCSATAASMRSRWTSSGPRRRSPTGEVTAEAEAYQEEVYAKTSDGRARDLPRADPDRAAGIALHLARLPADPGPEPDLHGVVLAGHAGRRLHRERRRHDRLRAGRLLRPRARERVGLARLQGREERRWVASRTGAPPGTSCSATGAATRSTSTRSRCRRRPSRAAASLPGTPTFPRVSGDDAVRIAHAGVRLVQGQAAQEAQARPLLLQPDGRQQREGEGLQAGDGAPDRAPEGEDLPQPRARVHLEAASRAQRLLRRPARHAGPPNGSRDVRHVAMRRRNGRFYRLPAFDRRASCALVQYCVARPVGLRRAQAQAAARPLPARPAARPSRSRSGAVTARSSAGSKAKSYPSGKSRRKIRLGRKAKRGAYRITLKADAAGPGQRADAARALPVASRDR